MAIVGFLAAIDQEKLIIAKQAAEGTAAPHASAEFYVLNSTKLAPKRESSYNQFRRAGSRGTSVSRKDTEHTTFAITGTPDYNELGYLYTMSFGIPVTTAVPDTTLAFQHVWTVKSDAPNPPYFYTAYWGTGEYIRRVIDMRGDGVAVKGERPGKMEATGSGFGKAMEDKVRDTLTFPTNVNTIAMAPMAGPDVAVKLYEVDAVAPAFILNSLMWEMNYGAIAAPVFDFNRTMSYDKSVEQKEPKGTAKLVLPHSNAYLALMEILEAGTPLVMEVDSIGPIIEDDVTYYWNHTQLVLNDKDAEDVEKQHILALDIPLLLADDGSANIITVTMVNTIETYA
jgi:hypothetical protein